MSDTANRRHVKCKFGLVNLAGLIPMRCEKDEQTGAPLSAEILVPLFSHESYKVKTTFNTNLTFFGTSQEKSTDFAKLWFDIPDASDKKHYQTKFRRDVLWDFGDGTQVNGYSAEHHYSKPGRYKITCTFFDINRRGWVNDFCLYVVVKEVIPTMLRFDKEHTKSSIKCSKIERITRLESLISNNVDKELNVFVNRIFSKEEHESGYEEIGRSYDEIEKTNLFHMEKYWCILKNTQTLFYNSDQIYTSELSPSCIFTPRYNKLYCKFFYDEVNKESAPIGLSFYQVIPYKNIDDNLKSIVAIDPFTKIIDEELRKTYTITQVFSEDQLPEGVTYCGMRGWVDVFYKTDYINHDNTISIFFDVENENITGELYNSPNHLNINPLGLTFSVDKNNEEEIRIGMTGNGFLKPIENSAKLSDSLIFIDQHLRNSLYKGIDLDCYVFPYITYDNNDVKIMDDTYYIPKDVSIDLSYSLTTDEKFGKASEVNTNPAASPIYPWVYRIPMILNDYVDISFNVILNEDEERNYIIRLTQKPLQNPLSLNIPQEKRTEVDVERLLDTYMAHPMFKDKNNLRDLLKTYVSGFVEKIITEGDNFLDNTANIRTCYLNNLLSTLKMMGQSVVEYEYSNLEGINDLKKFSRLLSMNHSDLVGHVINEDYDITINKDNKGVNVGDYIDLDDVLTLITDKPAVNEPNKKDYYGKIQYVQKDSIKRKVKIDGGVDLIVHDKYTNMTKIVNFRSCLNKVGKQTVSIGEYESEWDWNLLLPDGFTTLKEKIDLYASKANNPGYSTEQINFFITEIQRLKNARKELIGSYYDFYLLNPNKGNLRIGNFIREEDITDKIDSTKEWDSEWGIKHDILMKIMFENGDLMNNRTGGDDYNGSDGWKSYYLNLSKSFRKGEINVIINKQEDISLYGDVILRGEILGEGKNFLYFTTHGCSIDYEHDFWVDEHKFICSVSGNNLSGSNTYKISSNIIDDLPVVRGNITVTLSGTIENPVVTVEANMIYVPAIEDGEYPISLITGLDLNSAIQDGDTSIQSSIDGSIKIPTYFYKSELYIRRYNKKWQFIIKGDVQSGLYQPKDYYNGWQLIEQLDETVDIEVDEFGNITPLSHEISLQNSITTNTPKLQIELSGNVYDYSTKCDISFIENPKGIYVFLFDIDETYQIEQYYNNVSFSGIDEYDTVKVFFSSKEELYTQPVTLNAYSKDIKLQVIKDTEPHYDLTSTLTNEQINITKEGFIQHGDFQIPFNDDAGTLDGEVILHTIADKVGIQDYQHQNIKYLKVSKVFEYSWNESFTSDGHYPYDLTMTLYGKVRSDSLDKDNPTVTLNLTISGTFEKEVVNLSTQKTIGIEFDGTLKESCEFELSDDSKKFYSLKCKVTCNKETGSWENFQAEGEVSVVSPYDISEANGYIPNANEWNNNVLRPNMNTLRISIVNEEGEMLNND